jgi:hypothetical protein
LGIGIQITSLKNDRTAEGYSKYLRDKVGYLVSSDRRFLTHDDLIRYNYPSEYDENSSNDYGSHNDDDDDDDDKDNNINKSKQPSQQTLSLKCEFLYDLDNYNRNDIVDTSHQPPRIVSNIGEEVPIPTSLDSSLTTYVKENLSNKSQASPTELNENEIITKIVRYNLAAPYKHCMFSLYFFYIKVQML